MINIFVTYRCNLSCPYCFAEELREEHPADMGPETFARLLNWMRRSGLAAAAFLGGEPTLHPLLVEMIEATQAAGVSAVLFTNGLFPRELADRLAPSVSNFVVNLNERPFYAPSQAVQLNATLSRLSEMGARITFSKNFSMRSQGYEDLLEAAARYGVRAVRYDFSRPGRSARNDHLSLEETGRMLRPVLDFVRKCEERGVKTGLDCCVRFCDLSREELRYLKRVSMKFTGICHPSIDIHPDLSASYCLPLYHVRVADVTSFPDDMSLMRRFSEMVRSTRYGGVNGQCLACPEYQRTCQGGCMALKERAAGVSHAPSLTHEMERIHDGQI